MMNKLFPLWMWMAGALTLSACSGEKEAKETTQKEALPKVKLATTSTRDVAQTNEYTATIESDVKNHISSNAASLRIEQVLADVGDVVRKGQLLVKLDAQDLLQLELELKNQRTDFKRIDELYKVGGVSKAEWDNARTQLQIKELLYQTKADNTRLLCPINGVVTARNFDDGDLPAGQPILTIESITPVKMTIHVSETRFPLVSKGMPAEITLDTYPGETFTGRVSKIDPVVNPNTHTFGVEITLNSNERKVRPGMFARATLSYGVENHSVVPDAAVVKQMGAGDHYVYVYNNGTVSYNKVVLGRRLGDEYEIVSGVPAGAQVVIAGQTRLANGAKVEVVK